MILKNTGIDEKHTTYGQWALQPILSRGNEHYQLFIELTANKAYTKQGNHRSGRSLDKNQTKP